LAHDLEIEKGRYTGVKAHQRFCKLCSSEVEDEIHFLLKCSALDTTRSSFIENIKVIIKILNLYLIRIN
jgi:hypothetical protein